MRFRDRDGSSAPRARLLRLVALAALALLASPRPGQALPVEHPLAPVATTGGQVAGLVLPSGVRTSSPVMAIALGATGCAP